MANLRYRTELKALNDDLRKLWGVTNNFTNGGDKIYTIPFVAFQFDVDQAAEIFQKVENVRERRHCLLCEPLAGESRVFRIEPGADVNVCQFIGCKVGYPLGPKS